MQDCEWIVRIGIRCTVRTGLGLDCARLGIRCKVRILCRIRIGLYRMRVVVLNLSLNFICDCIPAE